MTASDYRNEAQAVELRAEECRANARQLAKVSYDLALAYNVAHESLKRLALALRRRADALDAQRPRG